MKLIIKLYKADGTCEEIPDTENAHEVFQEWNADWIIRRNTVKMAQCLTQGGRIEIAQDV